MATDWDLEAITGKWQERWWAARVHHADRCQGSGAPKAASEEEAGIPPDGPKQNAGIPPDGSKPTFFIHFAYPGISGYLHVGHMRGFTYTDVFARYKRMVGYDVLFPAGFHASGIPAVAFAKEVERGEKTQYLRDNGYTGPLEDLTDPVKVVEYFARVYQQEYWRPFGFLIDDRRNCTTIDPGYRRFIQWQFRRLKDMGYLVEKPHYAPYCPVAGPVAVDRSETDIKEGGDAEVQEFVALRFTVPAGELVDVDDATESIVLPCATLRPETLFGVTNLWVHPEHEYELVRVWRDGAVADQDPSEVWLVSRQGRVKLEWQMERAEALGITVPGGRLVGMRATAPLTDRQVPVVAGSFVDPMVATGLVMSVPAHAPVDWAAYVDAGLDKELGEPACIVDVEGYEDLPARQACRQHGVTGQLDAEALARATEQVYADEFNKGVLNDRCGQWAGERIKGVKDRIREAFVAADHGRVVRQFSRPVVSRAGEVVDIRRIPDQDFIKYSDPEWTAKAKEHAATMTVLPQRYAEEVGNVLEWFGDRACVRRGAWLGTEFPFKEGWIVEPIADSTFYPWYYIVSLYVNDGRLPPEDLTDAFFDYVYNGRGVPPEGAQGRLWDQVRGDVLHWGPVDINLGGKEHQTVHFPVYIMNQVALLEDRSLWPRGVFVNWWVTQAAGAKISKSKGGAEPIPGAARRYGVDPMRLYYCHVGSPHVDIEWDPEVVLTYRQHVLRLGRLTEELLEADAGPSPLDGWLEAAFARHLRTARLAYEGYDLRTAATELVYNVPETLRWYRRRGGGEPGLVARVLRDWARALCPMVPHVAEEMHGRAGGEGLCTMAAFPEPGQDADLVVLAREEQVRAVLEDLHTVRRLADAGGDAVAHLFTAPAWKRDLAARAVAAAEAAGGRLPVGAFMKEVMSDAGMRERGKEVQAFAGRLAAQVAQWSPGQRALLAGGVDEAALLREAAAFLASEAGMARVEVHAADASDAPEHPKRGAAAPLKPGIAVSGAAAASEGAVGRHT